MSKAYGVHTRRWAIVFGLWAIVLVAQLWAVRAASGACCACSGCTGLTPCVDDGSCDDPIFGQFLCRLRCTVEHCSGSAFSLQSCATIGCGTPAPVAGHTVQVLIALGLLGLGLYYLRRYDGPRTVRAVVMTVTLLSGIGVLYAAAQYQLGGGWQPAGQSALSSGAPPRWSAQLVAGEGGRVSGRVTVTGSPQLSGGNFQGQLAGNQLTGSLSDDSGAPLATIAGTAHDSTFEGQYTTPDGSSGSFSWDSTAF